MPDWGPGFKRGTDRPECVKHGVKFLANGIDDEDVGYVYCSACAEESREPLLIDRVLELLDEVELGLIDVRDRVPASYIAGQLSEDETDVEAALYALAAANLIGEEPPGYFWTDARDPAFQQRND